MCSADAFIQSDAFRLFPENHTHDSSITRVTGNINVITEIECAAVLLDLNINFCLYKSEEREDIWGLAEDSGMTLLL